MKNQFACLFVLLLGFLLSSCVTNDPTPVELARYIQQAEGRSYHLSAGPHSYNLAVRQLCEEMERGIPGSMLSALRRAGVTVNLPKVDLPLRHMEVIDSEKSSRNEVGVAVVLEYETSAHAIYPPEGLFVDATVIVHLVNDTPTVEFVTTGDSFWVSGKSLPLVADHSAASRHLARRARKLAASGFLSMIRPDSMKRKPQIYLLDPYERSKVPLLMVHGLQSTPVAFAQLVSALRSDPEVRRKYQLWQFYYPSGSPVLANAADLRESLSRTLQNLDPGNNSVARHGMVVLGHSMGGVISHTLVSSSGDAMWKSVFNQPPERLKGDRATVQSLIRILDFQERSDIKRVIFMAAPHHGSPMADSFIGWVGNSLSRLSPMEESGFSRLARENPEAMNPEASSFYEAGRFSAVRTLSPKSTALIALSKLPISIPYHSIIGQQHPGPKELGSDGVVPYWSSHLDGATSEIVVRSGHGVIGNSDAICEVIRILKRTND
jgi:pimeloyl-ACP methyl ester carboxylesterase